MTVRPWPSRLASRTLALCIPFVCSCASFGRSTASDVVPARRLVLALDGIDYRDIVAARARGLFAQFREPSRLISTFPSISDIAWHEIFAVQAPRGYQRIYYSTNYNVVAGTALDAIRPIEYEDRMDLAFGAKFHHLGAYLMSNTVARREVDVDVRDFFRVRGRETVYVYNVGPDALQHTRGDLDRYLAHLDQRLNELQVTYRQRTGRPLEIVVLSDHGHNRGVNARFLPVSRELEAHGFRASSQLRAASDIAFSVDGVTTGFGVFASADSVATVARLLGRMEGVDVVSTRLNDSVFAVHRDSLTARIERRERAGGTRYRYVPLVGDPLRYASILLQMRADRVVDDEGFADSRNWVRYTATAAYPAAVERIARGHTTVTLNPAPILVSLTDGFRVGLGMVSVANRMRPLGGTHGALSATNSLGVLMTNFVETHDDITTTVRAQLDGFNDLGPVRYTTSGARLTSAALIDRDRRNPFFGAVDAPLSTGDPPLLEVWLTLKDRAWMGATGAMFVEVIRSGRGDAGGEQVASSYLPIPLSGMPDSLAKAPSPTMPLKGWQPSPERHRFLLPMARVLTEALQPSTAYEVRVSIDRVVAGGRANGATTKAIAAVAVRTNARAELWPY